MKSQTKDKKFGNSYNPDILNGSGLTENEKSLLAKVLLESDYKGNRRFYNFYLFILILLFCIGAYFLFQLSSRMIRYGAIPLLLFFIYRLKAVQSDFKEAGAGYKMKNDWRRPILYLRSFDSDGAPEIENVKVSTNLLGLANFKYSVERRVWRMLQEYGPLVALRGSSIEGFGVPAKIKPLSDNNWEKAALAFMKVSSAVVFVVTNKITESIKWELKQLSQFIKPERIMFFLPKEGVTDKGIQIFFNEVKSIINQPVELKSLPKKGNRFICYYPNKGYYGFVMNAYGHIRKLKINDNRSKFTGYHKTNNKHEEISTTITNLAAKETPVIHNLINLNKTSKKSTFLTKIIHGIIIILTGLFFLAGIYSLISKIWVTLR